ncbi:phage protein NinX family protein [Burkholderia cepacia]|uniref:phage protein NinX family protein n=1 Tax=Burkholderia cepacia TaxID=292 RepID=UPI001CF434F4|nr:phage protein NinX family protein [Burkholderia cepacia]MCA8026495.1 DUF2591 domain-containing protein [Burkholderia cepacia]
MKVGELSGALLDYWVCKGEGLNVIVAMRENCGDTEPSCLEVNDRGVRVLRRSPSTSWWEGGPIIERERIILKPFSDGEWGAAYEFDSDARGGAFYISASQEGATPLVAAMRAYVASKFGDEVSDEE